MRASSAIVLAAFLMVCTAAAHFDVTPLPTEVGRGTVFFVLQSKDLDGDDYAITLKDAKLTLPGLSFVALQWIWTMPEMNSSFVLAPPHKSPNVTALGRFVETAHALNLSVLLKPVVSPASSGLMFKISPVDPIAWFASYRELLLPVAKMAAEHKVWCLSVGLELQHLVATEPAQRFQDLIHDVRTIAPQLKLTYAANPGLFEYLFVKFWLDLDYVGLDPYFSVASASNLTPTFAEMEAAFAGPWSIVAGWWRDILVPLANNTSNGTKSAPPILVTEFGYPSSNMGLVQPFLMPRQSQGGCTGEYAGNTTAQAAAFAVAFNGFGGAARDGAVALAGVAQFWWGMAGTQDYFPNRNQTGSLWACGWTPTGKNESIDVMRRAFS